MNFFFHCLPDHLDKNDTLTQSLSSKKKENLSQIDFARTDALFDLGWFGNVTDYDSDQSVLKDAFKFTW